MSRICVIGSLNIDLSIRIPAFHAPGETVTGLSIETFTGGKGGNQAVAASRLGTDVLMAGLVGQDSNGAHYRSVLAENNIDTSLVEALPAAATGVALIEVDAKGENRIIVVPGTNALLDIAFIDRHLPHLLCCDIFLLQLEIPLETVCYAADVLHAHGKTVILDPAPAVPLPSALYQHITYLTPNRTELALLTKLPTDTLEAAEKAARVLLEKGAKAIVAKLGAEGCFYVDAQGSQYCAGFSVNTRDTTAAGDCFNAAFGVALAMQLPLRDALSFANAAAALSTTAIGAQGGMPTVDETQAFLAQHKREA